MRLDNIPFAATMIPGMVWSLAQAGGMDLSVLAWALSTGTDTAAAGTPIGASAKRSWYLSGSEKRTFYRLGAIAGMQLRRRCW
ncbi:MAG: hypothetical protein ACLT76_00460 [Clostridium fessum]